MANGVELGKVDRDKTKKRMRDMINKGAGQPVTQRDESQDTSAFDEEKGRQLLLSLRLDESEHGQAIKMNLLENSGLRRNPVERDLNVLEDSVKEAARHLRDDQLETALARHFGMPEITKTTNRTPVP